MVGGNRRSLNCAQVGTPAPVYLLALRVGEKGGQRNCKIIISYLLLEFSVFVEISYGEHFPAGVS